MLGTRPPCGNPLRDPLAARMLKSFELSEYEKGLPIPKIRYRGNLVPPSARDRCKICSRHFLSPAARTLLQSQNDYINVDEGAARQSLQDLSHGIQANWLRLRECSQQAANAIPSLKAEMLQEFVTAAFPGLLSDKFLANIRYQRYLGVSKVSDINDGLKLPDFWTDMTIMQAGVDFVVDVIRGRSSRHPSQFVAVDNSELQLGWTSLLFQFTASNIFVNLSPASYGAAAISTPVEPSALHSTHIFTYERGILILQRQELLYQGLADVVVKICGEIGTSPCASLSPITIPSSTDRSALTQLYAEAGSHACRVTYLLETTQASLLTYTDKLKHTNHTENNADTLDSITAWLLDAGCPPDVVFGCAVSIHVDDRLDLITALFKLRHSLRRLSSAAKARLERNESKTKLMEAREEVELDVTGLMSKVACYLVKQNKYFGNCMPVLFDHSDDYLELLRCNSDHISNGSTRTIWHLFGLIELRAPVSDTIDLTVSEVTKTEGQFRPGAVQELMPCIELCGEVVDTIEIICPCIGVMPKSRFAGLVMTTLFTSSLRDADLEAIEDLCSNKRVESTDWATMLWSKALQPLEHVWEMQKVDDVSRQSLRRLLGMRQPLKKPKRTGSQAALPEDAGNAIDTELGGEEGHDVAAQPSTQKSVRAKAQRIRVQDHDPLAHLFHVNESLSKFGVSEGFRWGTTPTTPRPSQFDDGSETYSSRPRVTKRWQVVPAVSEEDVTSSAEIVAPAELPTPEPIIFADEDLYDIWRQVFPLAGEARRGNTRSRIKWHDLRRVLVAEPLSMAEIRVAGIECKWRRPALHGYEEQTITLHRPHASNGWLEKTYLIVIRGMFRHVFGWDAESFALKA